MVTSPPQQATGSALIVFGAFQLALAVGAPWGRAAYGGTHYGALPGHLRTISGVAALGYGTGAVLVLRGSGSPRARVRAFTAMSVIMGIGAVANGASRSPVERALWTPVTAATTVLAWRSRTARAPLGHEVGSSALPAEDPLAVQYRQGNLHRWRSWTTRASTASLISTSNTR